MNMPLHRTPTPPEGARYIRVGERIHANDLQWDGATQNWRLVPADLVGTELTPAQFHFFCRRVM